MKALESRALSFGGSGGGGGGGGGGGLSLTDMMGQFKSHTDRVRMCRAVK